MAKYFIFILLLLKLQSIYAQRQVCIKGIVSDKKTKEQLLGANVYFKSNKIGISTDLEGSFELSIKAQKLPDTLSVSYLGYETLHEIIDAATDTLNFNFKLNPSKNTMLQEIKVSARLPIAEDFVIKKMSFLDIVLNPSSNADPILSVRSLPSSTTTDESASISLRGSNATQTGVFLNDIPIYDAVKFAQLSGIGTYSIFNVNLIKNVLVFASNPPLEYGNVGSGLISLTTDEKIINKFGEVSIGLAQSGMMLGVPIKKNSTLKIFSNIQSHQLLKTINLRAFEDLLKFNLKDIGIHWASNLPKNLNIKSFSYMNTEQYQVLFRHPSLIGNYNYDKKRFFSTLSIAKTAQKYALYLNTGLSISSQNDSVGNYFSSQANKDFYLGIDYRYFFSNKMTIKTGYNFDSRKINLKGNFPIYSYDYRINSASFADTTIFGRNINEVYLYGKYTFNEKLSVGIGIRKNLEVYYLSKQIHTRYAISEKQFLNFSLGETNSYAKTTNNTFELTKTKQWSLDYAYEKDNTDASIAIYQKAEKYGSNTQHTKGIELYLKKTLKKWSFDVSLSSIKSQVADTSNINYISVHSLPIFLKNMIQYSLPFLTIGTTLNFRSGTPYTPVVNRLERQDRNIYEPIYGLTNSQRLPEYFRCDVLLSKYLPSKKNNTTWILYLTIGNILNFKNISNYSYSVDYKQIVENFYQKRTLYFGLTYSFK